jgi:signal peptidase
VTAHPTTDFSAGGGLFRAAFAALRGVQIAASVLLLAAISVVLVGVLPTFFGAESFTVYSGSMVPTNHVGAHAVVRGSRTSELKPGDVITYRTPQRPDTLVTHRLVGITETADGKRQFRTKGDANTAEDVVLTDQGAVLGKVVYSVPYAGYIVEFSRRLEGRLLLIAAPALLLAVDYLRSRVRRSERRHMYQQIAAAVDQGSETAQAERARLLIERGRQALAAGRADLAARAAEGVLAIDPRSVDAWVLRIESAEGAESREALLQTALVLNPRAPALTALHGSVLQPPPSARGAHGAVNGRDPNPPARANRESRRGAA